MYTSVQGRFKWHLVIVCIIINIFKCDKVNYFLKKNMEVEGHAHYSLSLYGKEDLGHSIKFLLLQK